MPSLRAAEHLNRGRFSNFQDLFYVPFLQSFVAPLRAVVILLLGGIGVVVDLNGVDPNLRIVLAMTLQLLVLLLPLVVEDQDLVAATLAKHGSDNLGGRRFGDRFVPAISIAGNSQHFAELDGAILASCGLLNLYNVARGDTILLSTGTN